MVRAIAPTISAPPLVTGKELASALGLSEAHIFTLKRRHIVQSVQARKNTFHLGARGTAFDAKNFERTFAADKKGKQRCERWK